jgi:hypothetical protein
VNVLSDTHRALVPGGDLVDFHPVFPPWSRVDAAGETLGEIEEPDFPEQLRAAEGGMDEVVARGLFRPLRSLRHDIREHYDDADELVDAWEGALAPELERIVRAVPGPLVVVNAVVFRLYRSV